jgi:hypothetical protein
MPSCWSIPIIKKNSLNASDIPVVTVQPGSISANRLSQTRYEPMIAVPKNDIFAGEEHESNAHYNAQNRCQQ